jgi:hypothetical protein
MSSKTSHISNDNSGSTAVAVRKVCSWRSEPGIWRVRKGVKWEGVKINHSNTHSFYFSRLESPAVAKWRPDTELNASAKVFRPAFHPLSKVITYTNRFSCSCIHSYWLRFELLHVRINLILFSGLSHQGKRFLYLSFSSTMRYFAKMVCDGQTWRTETRILFLSNMYR